MKKLVLFILVGLLSAIPGEVLNQILSRQNPGAFRTTLLSYSILLFIGFFVGFGLQALFKRKVHAALANYLFFGTLGLMVEWFLLGNGPALDPFQIVTQPGMFTFWGTMLLSPWILMDAAEFIPLKRTLMKYFVCFSTLYLLVASLLPRANGGIFFGFIIFAGGYVGLNYFYFKYFKQLAADIPAGMPQE
ncbi:MAG TPA: hypothetical protein VFL42_10930 [Terriglobales bacterium]|nr:hypothetical protein [Terriglobales bacterium]